MQLIASILVLAAVAVNAEGKEKKSTAEKKQTKRGLLSLGYGYGSDIDHGYSVGDGGWDGGLSLGGGGYGGYGGIDLGKHAHNATLALLTIKTPSVWWCWLWRLW